MRREDRLALVVPYQSLPTLPMAPVCSRLLRRSCATIPLAPETNGSGMTIEAVGTEQKLITRWLSHRPPIGT